MVCAGVGGHGRHDDSAFYGGGGISADTAGGGVVGFVADGDGDCQVVGECVWGAAVSSVVAVVVD